MTMPPILADGGAFQAAFGYFYAPSLDFMSYVLSAIRRAFYFAGWQSASAAVAIISHDIAD